MKKIKIKVLGPENPCRNCMTTQKNVETAVNEIHVQDIEFEVLHSGIKSREIVENLGLLRSPAVVAGGYVLFQGEVPPVEKIVRKIKDFVELL
ncbi:MAG: thioredoxin family protein [Promethearchaeota archaeon]